MVSQLKVGFPVTCVLVLAREGRSGGGLGGWSDGNDASEYTSEYTS